MPSDRNLDHLYPAFRAKVELVLADMAAYAAGHMIGHKWIVVEGFRTAKYQNELYQKGRTIPGSVVTFRDGYKKRSNHQSSLAVDIAPQHGHDIDWQAKLVHWEYLGHCARAHGLHWGGDWQKIKDMPHCEWDEADEAAYKAAAKWQKENGLA